MGMDAFCDEVNGTTDEIEFVTNNMGKRNYFPCGPVCAYRGKEVPCFCRWTENGSITSEILADICKTLDSYNIFDRSDGKRPFL